MKLKNMILPFILIICLASTAYIINARMLNNNQQLQTTPSAIPTHVLSFDELFDQYTEEGITNTFKENHDVFSEIAAFFENDSSVWCFYKTSEQFIAEKDRQDIDMQDVPIKDQILYVIDTLGYCGIIEFDDNIEFRKKAGNPDKGIIYLKNKGIENETDDITGKIKLIEESWYYFMFVYQDDEFPSEPD